MSAFWRRPSFPFAKDKYPIIVPPGEHPVSPSLIEEEVRDIMNRLMRNGFQACVVGGGVRDILLGRKPKDMDIATDAHPRQVKRLFRRCFLIGRRFRLAHVYITQDRFIEVATFRGVADPEKMTGGRHEANNVYGTMEEDARRRDFTVNALYYNGADRTIIDYTGGLKDLKKKILRSIGEPAERFREDPVRMVRAARFCAQFGLIPSRGDMKAARACTHLIKEANSRRLIEELYKILRCGASAGAVVNLKEYGLMQHWIPELAAVQDHGNLVSRLRVVDRRHGEGETISTGVLIAALMYDLFEESLYKNNAQPRVQEAFETLMRDFKDPALRISISRREWDHLCGITARLGVFSRIGQGSRWRHFEKKFVRNEYFKDAFLLFQIIAEASGRHAKEVEYWKRCLSDAPQEHKEPQERRQVDHAAHRKGKPRHPRGPRVN